MVAAALGLVQLKLGFAMVSVELNGPTSAPPEPLNVKVPPAGITPAARVAPSLPLMPSCAGSVIGGPVGPVRVTKPASRPTTVIAPPVIIGYTAHEPVERLSPRPVAPARSPLDLKKLAPALLLTV